MAYQPLTDRTTNGTYGSFYAGANPAGSGLLWTASQLNRSSASSSSTSRLASLRLIEEQLSDLDDYYLASPPEVSAPSGQQQFDTNSNNQDLPSSQWPENLHSCGYGYGAAESDSTEDSSTPRHYTDLTRPVELDTGSSLSTLKMPTLPYVSAAAGVGGTISSRPLIAGSDLLLRPYVTRSKPLGTSGAACVEWRWKSGRFN